MDPSLHGSDENEGESSGDELLNVQVPGVRRQQLGSFLGADGNMRTAAHRLAWQSFIQTASSGEGGLRASLGHGMRRRYFQQNNTQLYSSGGPFASFECVKAERTQRAVSVQSSMQQNDITTKVTLTQMVTLTKMFLNGLLLYSLSLTVILKETKIGDVIRLW